ncbi:MAG: hypothetical protein ABIN89_05265 [Chitinophagaceae bacterium]
MKYIYLAVLLYLTSCSDDTAVEGKKTTDTTFHITMDTVPEKRKVVSKKPVASYLVPVNDPKLERSFGVDIYETGLTFEYIMHMHYEAVFATDTLRIPNFGIWPQVQVKPGEEKISCIIGFLDKKKAFKPYKMVSAKGNKMRLEVLKNYFVGRYSTPVR